MNLAFKALAISAAAAFAFAGAAAAQNYNNWGEGEISPLGLERVDALGNSYYCDPYSYECQVDINGNVINSFNGELEPSLDFNELYPTQTDPSFGYTPSMPAETYVPYPEPADSHEKFINSIWE